MINRVTDEYVRQCLHGNSGLLNAMGSLNLPPALSAAFGSRLSSRPFFIDEAEIRQCGADLVELFEILAALPDRFFGGDISAYCATLGIDDRRTRIMKRFPRTPDMYGRADLYHDGESFKLLEYNVDSALGGIDRAEISRLLLDVRPFHEFAETFDLSYVHTGERLAQILHDASLHLASGSRPVVAFVEANGDLSKYQSVYRSYQEMLQRCGLDVVLGELHQVQDKGGRILLGGKPIDVILRCFDIEELIADRGGAMTAESIFRAHDEGRVVLWTEMQSGLVGNKGCLGLVSDLRTRGAFSKRENEVIDRILPWTRTLVDGPTETDEGVVDLIDYCKRNQKDLVLKPNFGHSGAGIVIGWESSSTEWSAALFDASKRGYVVQRRVIPRAEPVMNPESRRIEHWNAVWGVFVNPEGYAGAQIRAVPVEGSGVINLDGNSTVRVGAVFHSATAEN
ncbi:glutathionylspermidine synthase family protein [Streptomyces bikiniensis]|uniref:Glutathionylspermidine synthase family protein n=1 Tax=Streptomyces bikiniensis TaxID=1896 RepID=A0ABW8D1D4_STRBI